MRIHNGIRSLKDDERLAAWVYRIAHNTLLDHFRKGAASKEVLTDEIVVPEDPPESNYNEELGIAFARWFRYSLPRAASTMRASAVAVETQA